MIADGMERLGMIFMTCRLKRNKMLFIFLVYGTERNGMILIMEHNGRKCNPGEVDFKWSGMKRNETKLIIVSFL